MDRVVQPKLFEQHSANIWEGTHHWQDIVADGSIRFPWDRGSTYLRRPVYTKYIARSADRIPVKFKQGLGGQITSLISPAKLLGE